MGEMAYTDVIFPEHVTASIYIVWSFKEGNDDLFSVNYISFSVHFDEVRIGNYFIIF